MYFVYILVCTNTGRSYFGHTDDLLRRFRMHMDGTTRWTREKLANPYMVYWESFPTRSAAMRRERYFKTGSGHRLKRELIAEALRFS